MKDNIEIYKNTDFNFGGTLQRFDNVDLEYYIEELDDFAHALTQLIASSPLAGVEDGDILLTDYKNAIYELLAHVVDRAELVKSYKGGLANYD